MANTAYYLKRSRVAIVFQIGLLFLIQCLVSVLLPVWLAVLILIMLLFSFWLQLKRATLHYFEAFSIDEWSIRPTDQGPGSRSWPVAVSSADAAAGTTARRVP